MTFAGSETLLRIVHNSPTWCHCGCGCEGIGGDTTSARTARVHLAIQWHLTTRCENRCRHCYMFDDSTYADEAAGELDLDGQLRILDSIAAFEAKWHAVVRTFAVTGGDPLLHPQWREFLAELQARGKAIRILGNPETLTEANLAYLRQVGVGSFQVSLDGLAATHDSFRSPGSFQRTVRAIGRLKEYGISTRVMFTLFPENQDELLPLVEYIARHTAADNFSFDLGAGVGNATTLSQSFSAEAVQDLFTRYVAVKEKLRSEGLPLRVREKNNFFLLLRYARGAFFPFEIAECAVAGGCLSGWRCVAIMSNGRVPVCRRLPQTAGDLTRQSFEEVFLGSPAYRRFRRVESYRDCGVCDFYRYCRGCPAVVQGLAGDPFASHPLCFRDALRQAGDRLLPLAPVLTAPLDASVADEFELVASHADNVLQSRFEEFLQDQDVGSALYHLLAGDTAMKAFLRDPDAWLDSAGLKLDGIRRLFVSRLAGRLHEGLDDAVRAELRQRLCV